MGGVTAAGGLVPGGVAGGGGGGLPRGRGVSPSLRRGEHLAAGPGRGPGRGASVSQLSPRRADRLPTLGNRLSGGEQQMLAVARALAREIKLLLLDEPYEGLAPVIVQEIEAIVAEIKTLGMTTIIVEQNVVEALELADRAIILDMGQMVFNGPAQDVMENAELRQEYLAI